MDEKWRAIVVPVLRSGTGTHVSEKELSKLITVGLNALAEEDRTVIRPVYMGDYGVLLAGQLEEYDEEYEDRDLDVEPHESEGPTLTPIRMKSPTSLAVLNEAMRITRSSLGAEIEVKDLEAIRLLFSDHTLSQMEGVREDFTTLKNSGAVDGTLLRILRVVLKELEQNIKMSLS